jgi:hypothetical protein
MAVFPPRDSQAFGQDMSTGGEVIGPGARVILAIGSYPPVPPLKGRTASTVLASVRAVVSGAGGLSAGAEE